MDNVNTSLAAITETLCTIDSMSEPIDSMSEPIAVAAEQQSAVATEVERNTQKISKISAHTGRSVIG